MTKELVLIVDDDIYMYALMKTVLDTDYEVHYAKDGAAALESIARNKPKLVLMDIEMAGMSGYEACKRIKGGEDEDPPSVIFVSAHCTPEERLAAYAVGADDFITKPLAPEELYRKVEQTMRSHQEMESLKLSAREAMTVAISAMSDTGALGTVIQLFRKLFMVSSLEELAGLLLEAANEYNLVGTAQIRHGGQKITLNTQGRSSLMESVLLDNLGAEGKRIVDYGARSAFNYGSVSLLIKNMPVEDSQQYGKLKDYLALLVEGAAERTKAIGAEAITRAVGDIQGLLANINTRYKQQQDNTLGTINDMMKELEDSLIFLGLTDRQENALMTIVSKATQRITQIHNEGLEIDQYLNQAVGELAKVRE